MVNLDFKNILEKLIIILQGLSTIVIIWGIAIQFALWLKSEIVSKTRKTAVENVTTIKNFLGTYILFGLEILIGADIIESILDPSLNHILGLAAIVIIRTIISYFLNKEIEYINKN
ncbi:MULTISPECIES: DUF1622 domain-containing protein [Romboutsia]|uniref:DUF1622 domain-containing protein n=1 Tax=Romboutsia TaxID=1501226 RepID=UPI001411C6F9|nr:MULTISPECIES: DUF1622 domain-containing protein [Romboutsia]